MKVTTPLSRQKPILENFPLSKTDEGSQHFLVSRSLGIRSPCENKENLRVRANQEPEKSRETIFGTGWNQSTVFGKHPSSSPLLLADKFKSGEDIRRTKGSQIQIQQEKIDSELANCLLATQIRQLHEMMRSSFPNLSVPKAHLDLLSLSESLDRFVWVFKMLLNNLNKLDTRTVVERQNNLIQKYKETLEKRDLEISGERERSERLADQLANANKKLVEEGKKAALEAKKLRAKLDDQQEVMCQLAKELLDLKTKLANRGDGNTPRDPKRYLQFDKTSTEELMGSSRQIPSMASTARNISPICGEKEAVRDTEVREAGLFADICTDFLITFKEQHRSTSRTVGEFAATSQNLEQVNPLEESGLQNSDVYNRQTEGDPGRGSKPEHNLKGANKMLNSVLISNPHH